MWSSHWEITYAWMDDPRKLNQMLQEDQWEPFAADGGRIWLRRVSPLKKAPRKKRKLPW